MARVADMDHYQPDDLLPIGKAAKMLGVSITTLRRWDKAGRIKAIRYPDGQRRFRVGDLEAIRSGRGFDQTTSDGETWKSS